MGIPTCLECKTPWGHTLDCSLVLGWRDRAEKAEAEVARLRAALTKVWPAVAGDLDLGATIAEALGVTRSTSGPPSKG